MCQINNTANEEMRKAEVECLRRINQQCGDLLFKYGWKFDEEDKAKAKELIVQIKNIKDLEPYADYDNADYNRWVIETKTRIGEKL